MAVVVESHLESLTPKSVTMDVSKGCTLEKCKRDAALFALSHRVDVEFTFNGVGYITGWEIIIEQVKELK